MRIEEQKSFTFHLPFLSGLVSLNVAASTQTEAAQILKEWMNQTQKELALLFPAVAPQGPTDTPPATELNALQLGLISDLVTSISGYEKVKDIEGLSAAVGVLTDYRLTLENFKLIVPVLEKMKGQPQIQLGKPNDKKKA